MKRRKAIDIWVTVIDTGLPHPSGWVLKRSLEDEYGDIAWYSAPSPGTVRIRFKSKSSSDSILDTDQDGKVTLLIQGIYREISVSTRYKLPTSAMYNLLKP